ncbi:hypothetical protein FQR65_LT11550 [Abscondita terminalis]|nr:hypothetical protein FQR65_LT11550 [Abscondita terminalis]
MAEAAWGLVEGPQIAATTHKGPRVHEDFAAFLLAHERQPLLNFPYAVPEELSTSEDELDPKLLESDDASDDWSDMDDCTLSNLRDHQGLSDPDESANQLTLEAEKYFAVYYDVCWYLGRIISIAEDTCVVKFLKENLETFDWPPHEDKQVIKKEYVFYGSIQLKGSGPFTETRGDYIEIKKAYSLMKKKHLSS